METEGRILHPLALLYLSKLKIENLLWVVEPGDNVLFPSIEDFRVTARISCFLYLYPQWASVNSDWLPERYRRLYIQEAILYLYIKRTCSLRFLSLLWEFDTDRVFSEAWSWEYPTEISEFSTITISTVAKI